MSGGIRTEWHLADLTDDDDPFGAIIYSTGIEIDLCAGEDELAQTFVKLLHREGRLADIGVTCGLKDGGQDCLTCSHATLEPEERRSRLCRLGKDQLTVERRIGERTAERVGPLTELLERAGEFGEIGEIDGELAELLTAVGL